MILDKNIPFFRFRYHDFCRFIDSLSPLNVASFFMVYIKCLFEISILHNNRHKCNWVFSKRKPSPIKNSSPWENRHEEKTVTY